MAATGAEALKSNQAGAESRSGFDAEPNELP
jgi:hypothetical protein